MLIIFSICDRVELLPFFLRYYSLIGVTRFECALYNWKQNPFYDHISQFTLKYDLKIRPSIVGNIEDYNGNSVTAVMNRIREENLGKTDWYCIADLDEFHFFGGKSIPAVATEADNLGFDAVHGTFVDRIADDGTFPRINDSLDATFPLACDLTAFCGGCAEKIALARTSIPIWPGHHGARSSRIWRNAVEVHHFKWIKGIDEVMEIRYRREKRQGLPWADNLPNLIRILRNRVDFSDSRLKVRKASKIGV